MGMAKTLKFSDALRAAVDTSGQTRAQVYRALGISPAMFSRFMARKNGLSIERLDALAAYLGVEIVIRKQRKVK